MESLKDRISQLPDCYEVIEDEIGFYFRHDFWSCDSDDQWDIYMGVIEELGGLGLEFYYYDDYPLLEHDCLTGYLTLKQE